MPGPVSFVTDAITEGRQHNLDAYVKNLLTQPSYISRCTLIKQFFAPREGDYEIDPNAINPDEEYRLSGGSGQSSNDSQANGASRDSSRGNLNGGGYGGLSAAPARNDQHQRNQPSLSQNGTASAMKIKIYHGDDLIAMRVPTDVSYQQLYDRIRERLKIPSNEEIALFYKDEPSGEKPSMISDNDLNFALDRNEKLIIFVEYQN